MENRELLILIEDYKNNKSRNFKYCNYKDVFVFDYIKLKIKGVIEPNYGRMRLGYDLYFKNKKIKNLNGYGLAIDFDFNHYLENKFLFFPTEDGLIIIDIINQEIKIFHHNEILTSIEKIKFIGRELLFVNKQNYLVLNFDQDIIKVYTKENINLKKTQEFEIIHDLKTKKYYLNWIEKIIYKIKKYSRPKQKLPKI